MNEYNMCAKLQFDVQYNGPIRGFFFSSSLAAHRKTLFVYLEMRKVFMLVKRGKIN